MPLTNAERQKLHRRRIKDRLAGSAGNLDALAAELRSELQQDIAREYAIDLRIEDFVIEGLDPRYGMVFAPLILAALGLPADPWPGLTGEDLGRMTKGRAKEAKRRNLNPGATGELSLLHKLTAARHREWLEGRPPRSVT